MKALVVIALVVVTVVTASSAQQSATAISRLDIELWKATLQVIQHDKREPLALLNETLPAVDIKRTLRAQDREPSTLIDRALSRNEVIARISSPIGAAVDLVEIASVRKVGSEFDTDAIKARNQRVVRLSLPAISDDGTRALVFSWTSGGFNDSSGGGYLFEKKQGMWTFVDYVASWIT